MWHSVKRRPHYNPSTGCIRFPWWLSKESACSAGDLGSIPGLERYPSEGNGNPFQYSCLENPMDRRAWWVAKSWTDWVTNINNTHTHTGCTIPLLLSSLRMERYRSGVPLGYLLRIVQNNYCFLVGNLRQFDHSIIGLKARSYIRISQSE